jgi:iron-sulfur cluster repair protein YtfE (RIC family)
VNDLPTGSIRDEHRKLMPHLRHVEDASARVTSWDLEHAGRVLPRIVGFLRDELVPHAREEEEVLYPAIDRLQGAPTTATMAVDHIVIEERIEALVSMVDRALDDWDDADLVAEVSRQLAAIVAIVLLHFRKEEEVLLPILDAGLSPEQGFELFEGISHGHEHV